MRTAFVEALCEAAARDPRVWLVTGDLGYSLLEPFRARFPARFLNAGVAEQNMTGVAAGLALSGKVVFTYSIANFPTLRCLEQLRNDVCFHGLDVKVVAAGGGVAYGALGYTHHAVEDLAVVRALPNIAVLAPGDPIEARLATGALAARPGPAYLRLGRAAARPVHARPPAFEVGHPIVVRDGADAVLVATGGILGAALAAAERLAGGGVDLRVVSLHTLAPIDVGALRAAVAGPRHVFFAAEHVATGGPGEMAARLLADLVADGVVLHDLAIARETFRLVGSHDYLLAASGLDPAGMAAAVGRALAVTASAPWRRALGGHA